MSYLKEYDKLEELGKGGFATVYKVRHKQLGYIRAIRVLNERIESESDKKYQSFLEECKFLLRIGNGGHPHIVRIAKPHLVEGDALVEMEYIKGHDLLQYLNNNQHFASTKEVLNFAYHISNALAYCHIDVHEFCMDKEFDNLEKYEDPNDGSKLLIPEEVRNSLIEKYKVIHNDIHARNIIRKHDGTYILLDFGLAIQNNETIRSSKKNNGVCEYWAPERFDKVITEQTDIYSFGVLMYEMLAGRVPFIYLETDKKSYNETEEGQYWRKHKEELPPSISALRSAAYEKKNPGKTYTRDYPDWLERVIMKCLKKRPEDRYANGKELFAEIEREINRTCSQDNGEVRRLLSINNTLTHELSESTHRISSLESHIEILNKHLVKSTIDANNSKILQLEKEKKALEAKLDYLKEAETNINSKNETISYLQKELDLLRNKKHNLQQRLRKRVFIGILIVILTPVSILSYAYASQADSTDTSKYVVTISEKDAKIITLQNELSNIKSQISSSKANNSSELNLKNKRISDLEAEIQNLHKSISSSGGEKDKQINQLKQQVNNLNSKINQKENEIKGLKKAISEI